MPKFFIVIVSFLFLLENINVFFIVIVSFLFLLENIYVDTIVIFYYDISL